jgi:hypothetical protein
MRPSHSECTILDMVRSVFHILADGAGSATVWGHANSAGMCHCWGQMPGAYETRKWNALPGNDKVDSQQSVGCWSD